MGYSPWGHKESDTTEHHEMDPFNHLVAKQVSGTLRERLFQKEYLTEFLPGARAISHSYGSGEKGSF